MNNKIKNRIGEKSVETKKLGRVLMIVAKFSPACAGRLPQVSSKI